MGSPWNDRNVMEPLVSILIPAYNAERWIGDTVRSALNQTWPRKEIVIVDDGSRDGTLAAAKAFASATVKVLSQENRGASAARNRALELAQGDYIQWLDADDLLAPEKISEQMSVARECRSGMTLLTSSYGTFYWRPEKARFAPDALWQDLSPVEWLLKKFIHNYWLVPAVWLIDRRLTEMAGGWNEQLSLDDDGEYICRIAAASDGVRFVRQARTYYRLSGGPQLSMSDDGRAHESLFRSKQLCIGHLRSLEDSTRTREASLALVQRLYETFYLAGNSAMLQQTERLAGELGGRVTMPAQGWKWNVLRAVLGPRTANAVLLGARRTKFRTKIRMDRMCYHLMRRYGQGGFNEQV